MKFAIVAASWILLRATAGVQSFDELKALYRYDRTVPLDVNEKEMTTRGGYKMSSISYSLPNGGVMSGFLVLPEGVGRKSAIVWMHSGGAIQFLGDAILMARAGAISLLVGQAGTPPAGPRSKQGIS